MKCFRQGRSDTLQLLQIRSPGGYTDRLPGLRLLQKFNSTDFSYLAQTIICRAATSQKMRLDIDFGKGCSLFHGSGSFYSFETACSKIRSCPGCEGSERPRSSN